MRFERHYLLTATVVVLLVAIIAELLPGANKRLSSALAVFALCLCFLSIAGSFLVLL